MTKVTDKFVEEVKEKLTEAGSLTVEEQKKILDALESTARILANLGWHEAEDQVRLAKGEIAYFILTEMN